MKKKENIPLIKINKFFALLDKTNKINLDIPHIKEATTDKNEENTNNNLNVKNAEFDYYSASSFDIQFKDTSIFTERFIQRLKTILGSSTDFKKKSKHQKQQVIEELESLVSIEAAWKTMAKKINHEVKYIEQLFPEELENFKRIFLEFFYKEDKNKHINRKNPCFKIKKFYTEYIQLIINQEFPFLKKKRGFLINVEKINLDKLIQNIDPNILFFALVKLCMKKSVDNLFSKNYKNTTDNKMFKMDVLEEPFLFVKKTDVFYPFRTALINYLTNILIEYLYDNKLLNVSRDNISSLNHLLDTFMRDSYSKFSEQISKNEWYHGISDVSMQIISYFEKCGLILSIENVKKGLKEKEEIKVYGLPNRIQYSIPVSAHIPLIVKPVNLETNSDVIAITSGINYGTIDLMFSNAALKALNLSHGKKFRINEIYLKILQEMNDTNNDFVSCLFSSPKHKPFQAKKEYLDVVQNVKNFQTKIGFTCFQRYNFKRALLVLKNDKGSNKKKTKEFYEQINHICDITKAESLSHSQLHLHLRKLQNMKNDRQLFLTSITIAEIFKDFPIYYSNKLDFRTRMYPWQYLISRTTGFFKHLLMDYKGEKLTLQGFIHLLKAFYTIKPEVLINFNSFLTQLKRKNESVEKKTFNLIKNFYYENSFDIFEINKELPYFLTLQYNIHKILATRSYRVHINLEIDQNASGLVFLSLFLKNKSLASQCNLLQKDKQDVYTFIKNSTKKFLLGKEVKIKIEHQKASSMKPESNLITKVLKNNYTNNEELFEREKKTNEDFDEIEIEQILLSDTENNNYYVHVVLEENSQSIFEFFEHKKVTKYAVMCFCYNQTHKGRTDQWLEQWIEIFERRPTRTEFYILNYLSIRYNDFLETLFPNIISQLQIINNVLEIALKKRSLPKIYTLDGCIIKWDYYQTINIKRSFYNAVSQTHESYKMESIRKDGNSETVSRIEKHILSFLPHLIHSIDATIMRKFIVKINEKTGYTINHLHDCVLIHPNHVDSFFTIVNEIYTDPKIKDLAKTVFFDPIKSEVDSDSRAEIEKLEKEFFSKTDDFIVNEKTFEPENMYSYES